jgi:uncharacterized RDD family membrane protein YckC
VVGASGARGESLPVVQIWYAGENTDAVAAKQSFFLPPISGDPLLVAADAEALRVLYSDLTACDYFGNRPYSAGASWKDQCRGKPLAWAGDATNEVFWAVAETDELISQSTTSSPEEAAAGATGEQTADSRITLLMLRGGSWRRVTAPPSAAEGKFFWIASREGAVHLFWATGRRVMVSAGTSPGGTSREHVAWKSQAEVLADAEIRVAWAGATGSGAVFIAGRRSDSERFQLHVHMEKDGVWNAAGALREGNELLEIDPSECGVGIARGQIVLARPGRGGEVELGTAAPGVAPALRFAPPLVRQPDELEPRRPLEDAITLGVLLALLIATLWSRRDEAVRPIEFPRGLGPAAVWKRVLATPIDIAPAFLATSPWWMPKIAAFMQEHGMRLTGELQPVLAAHLRVETYATYVAYGLWCLLWEAAVGRTPGKMLVGCRVISVNGGPPGAAQCVVRNVIRMVMVSLGASGLIMTLMVILLVTRNRQRIGDLLAHTVVVEAIADPSANEDRLEEDAIGPFD